MTSFLSDEEEALLVEMIRGEESRTSAEIRVCVTRKLVFRPERYAWRLFEKIGMRKTRHRNGALIVMMPRLKKVIVLGDTGLDAVVTDDYWKDTVAAMVRQMHEAGPLESLRVGLRRLGDTLASHWPREDSDRNELSDEVLR